MRPGGLGSNRVALLLELAPGRGILFRIEVSKSTHSGEGDMAKPATLTPEMIDAHSAASHFRIAERPRADFGLKAKKKPAKPVELRRAHGRARTRGWRQRNDQNGRPESSDIARALLVALAMSPDLDRRLEREDLYLVAVALEMLEMCGFSRAAAKEAIFRFRERVIDGRAEMREAEDVRMKAFDEFVERAASRAKVDGFY
jgi:hypothetical protein